MRIIIGVLLSLGVLTSVSLADTITYGFDDGTFQGWEFITPEGDPFPDDSDISWAPSDEAIDIGDGFDLLDATSGAFRVVPDPWSNRDCLGGLFCYTQILRSPEFTLDGSGDLSIDMIGGGANGNQPFDPDQFLAPESPDDFLETKDSSGLQGFALLDVEMNQYVAHGFSIGENDGKARGGDPPHRANWDTVTISQDELKPFANNGRNYKIDIFDSYSGGWGWIGFDTVVIPAKSDAGSPGDIDGDGDCDADDIDALANGIRSGDNNPAWDLNADGKADQDDHTFLVEDIKNTYIGDSNLDGVFSSSDFVSVFQAGEYEDGVISNSSWATGDWNGDREFDSSDFVAAFQAGGFELGPRELATVPETNAGLLLVIGIFSICLFRTRMIRHGKI